MTENITAICPTLSASPLSNRVLIGSLFDSQDDGQNTTLKGSSQEKLCLRGWVKALRAHAKTVFFVLMDCTGEIQCVCGPEVIEGLQLKVEDTIEVVGTKKEDSRAKCGFEIAASEIRLLNRASHQLPFTSASDLSEVGLDTLLHYRPLTMRNREVGDIFRIQGAILQYFREYLHTHHFTEIITSRIVASGTEGGANLFELKYFDRSAYLAQSPQLYKEYGVVGFERVFETGHFYRAEPHASSRHLTEFYSLDLEMGFIDGPEEIIELERRLLTHIFSRLNKEYGEVLERYRKKPLPSMLEVPIWEFSECLEKLRVRYERTDLIDDLDPEGERQICALAEEETGVPAVFVIGYPLASRPFYTAPRGLNGAAQSFDLIFSGVEITTGGQRLHLRSEIEKVLRERQMNVEAFESHLQMYELGMPPHGGLAIGLQRLTALITGRANIKEATMYPRDRYRITP